MNGCKLVEAVKKNDLKRVKALLDSGVSIEATCREGQTPLMFAARYGNQNVVEYLLSQKARIDAQDSEGMTGLHLAVFPAHLETIRTLLAHRADVNLRDTSGDTPLMESVRRGCLEIATLLIKFGAQVNAQNRNGSTALMEAVRRHRPECIKQLLANGADKALRDINGNTVITIAEKHQDFWALQCLGEGQASLSLPTRAMENTNASRDPKVLEAILVDLLTYTGKDAPMNLIFSQSTDRSLAFDPSAHVNGQPSRMRAEYLLRMSEREKQQWDKLLSKDQQQKVKEATEHTVKRMQVGDLFDGFAPQDKRIRLLKMPVATPQDPFAAWNNERPITAVPPGYSLDRCYAFIQLSIPWAHPIAATYVLAEKDRKWGVILRQFHVYV